MKAHVWIVALFAWTFLFCSGQQAFPQQSVVDSLQAALKMAKDDTSRVNILCDICYEIRKRNPDSAITVGHRALRLANEKAFKPGIARAHTALGYPYINAKKYDSARVHLEKGLDVSQQLQLGETQAMALRSLAFLSRNTTTARSYHKG